MPRSSARREKARIAGRLVGGEQAAEDADRDLEVLDRDVLVEGELLEDQRPSRGPASSLRPIEKQRVQRVHGSHEEGLRGASRARSGSRASARRGPTRIARSPARRGGAPLGPARPGPRDPGSAGAVVGPGAAAAVTTAASATSAAWLEAFIGILRRPDTSARLLSRHSPLNVDNAAADDLVAASPPTHPMSEKCQDGSFLTRGRCSWRHESPSVECVATARGLAAVRESKPLLSRGGRRPPRPERCARPRRITCTPLAGSRAETPSATSWGLAEKSRRSLRGGSAAGPCGTPETSRYNQRPSDRVSTSG